MALHIHITRDVEFSENEHPREGNGKFAAKPRATLVEKNRSLGVYSSTSYGGINEALRAGYGAESSPKVPHLDELMEENVSTKPRRLYRVASPKMFGGLTPRPGMIVNEPAFMSTTSKAEVLESLHKRWGGLKMIVNVPAGVGAVDMNKRSGFQPENPGEHEVLLDRGHPFEVTSVSRGYVTVNMLPKPAEQAKPKEEPKPAPTRAPVRPTPSAPTPASVKSKSAFHESKITGYANFSSETDAQAYKAKLKQANLNPVLSRAGGEYRVHTVLANSAKAKALHEEMHPG